MAPRAHLSKSKGRKAVGDISYDKLVEVVFDCGFILDTDKGTLVDPMPKNFYSRKKVLETCGNKYEKLLASVYKVTDGKLAINKAPFMNSMMQ